MIRRLATALGMIGLVLGLAPAADAQDKIKVKMSEVVRSQFYVPMYVALTKGFVAEEGLEVDLITANGGDRVGAMILSDQADFALAGPEVPIYIYNGESPDKPLIFCALTATDGLFLASRQKIEPFSWSALNGKKIMGWRPGSTPELYLEYVLKKNGVEADTIKNIITNVAPAARDGAWLAGNADFAIFNEPNLTTLENAGHLHFFASVGKAVGRADYTAFFAKKSWLEKHGDIAQKWTNAIARAQAWVKTAPEKDIADAVMPFFPGLSVADNIAVVNRYRTVGVPIWATSPVVDEAGLAKLQEIMVIGGVLPEDKKLPYDKLVTNVYATKAQQKFAGQ